MSRQIKSIEQLFQEHARRMDRDPEFRAKVIAEQRLRYPQYERAVTLTPEIERDWTCVYLDANFNHHVVHWLNEFTTHAWAIYGESGYVGTDVYFENPDDAFAFKVRWGGRQSQSLPLSGDG